LLYLIKTVSLPIKAFINKVRRATHLMILEALPISRGVKNMQSVPLQFRRATYLKIQVSLPKRRDTQLIALINLPKRWAN